MNRMKVKVSLFAMIIALLSACGSPQVGAANTTRIAQTLFLGYIHNVQFAPLYVALERGYFAEQGFDVMLEPSYNETDGLTRIGVNKLQFGIISGEQIILARSKGAPVVYVFAWYQRFPVGIAIPADANITDPKALAGHVVSVPGKFGASYIGFQALLKAVNLKESDLKEVREIGFNTTPILCAKQVDASVIYVANEPLQVENKCFKVNVIKISDYANLVANGLVTNEETLKAHPDWVRGMNAAIAKGLADTIADPKAAYDISRKYVENLGDDPVQRQVLVNSVELWKAAQLGHTDPAGWKLSQDTLLSMGLIDKSIDLNAAYSNDYLPK